MQDSSKLSSLIDSTLSSYPHVESSFHLLPFEIASKTSDPILESLIATYIFALFVYVFLFACVILIYLVWIHNS